jgi:hypothetical protein
MEELPEHQPSVATLYQAAVGPKGQDFYMPYFQRAHQRGYAAISWNWPVFFVGFFWFLYRKLYLWAALVFIFPSGALIASGIVEDLAPGLGQPVLMTLIFGFNLIYLPMHANGIYWRWVKREIDRARTGQPDQHAAQLEHLQAAGGCNANLPFIIFGVFTALTVLLGSLGPPV